MDRNKVEEVIGMLERYSNFLWEKGEHPPLTIRSAIWGLKDALREPDADPCDECECEGCRAKVAEDELAEAFPTEPTSEDFGPCGPLEIKPVQFTFHNDQPSDYEIRLKAWNMAYDFDFEDAYCEFSATLDAATKLYNFLSAQNEDVK